MQKIKQLLELKQTVFSIRELYDIFPDTNTRNVDNFLYRTKKSGLLLNLRKGIWALPNYNALELACKIKIPSYISCETVLFKEGVIFQFYGNTFSCISGDSRRYNIDGKEYIYYKIQTKISSKIIGIRKYENYNIATPERALCDYIYLNPKGVIDAPESINKDRLKQILPLYPKSTNLVIQKLVNVW